MNAKPAPRQADQSMSCLSARQYEESAAGSSGSIALNAPTNAAERPKRWALRPDWLLYSYSSSASAM